MWATGSGCSVFYNASLDGFLGFRKTRKAGWMLGDVGWMLGDVGIVRWWVTELIYFFGEFGR